MARVNVHLTGVPRPVRGYLTGSLRLPRCSFPDRPRAFVDALRDGDPEIVEALPRAPGTGRRAAEN
jgi:hypothetical protein